MELALDFLARHLSHSTYLGLFLILSVGAFGFPIPEELVLIAAGLFVAQGVTSLGPTFAVCAAGQVLGDFLLYAVGRRWARGAYQGALRRWFPAERVHQVQARVERYGWLAIFFGRYLTGVRPAVFLAAGASGVPPRKFLLIDSLSAFVSLGVWVTIGYAFSGWIGLALRAVRNAEEFLLAGLLAAASILAIEWMLVRLGRLRASSPAVRLTNRVRIPLILVSVGFALVLAREHHLARRAAVLAAAESAGPGEIEDLSSLIEVLRPLVGEGPPVELVLVGSRDLLEAALAHGGYQATSGPAPAVAPLFGRGPDLFAVRPGADGAEQGMALWRTTMLHRSQPIWFGRFTRPVSGAELQALSRGLTRGHYSFGVALGPVIRPGEKQRVLWAVLRHPVLRE